MAKTRVGEVAKELGLSGAEVVRILQRRKGMPVAEQSLIEEPVVQWLRETYAPNPDEQRKTSDELLRKLRRQLTGAEEKPRLESESSVTVPQPQPSDRTARQKPADRQDKIEIASLLARLEVLEAARSRDSTQEGSSRMVTSELVEAGAAAGADPSKVFVIYGRNRDARREVFAFLRSIGLRPLEWDQAVALTNQASPYVGDVLTAGLRAAQAIVVLQTPDDIVYLDGDFCDPNNPNDPEGEPQGQPRPNVFFEAGMAMGVSPDRTIIVEFGPIKHFSDISGRHVVRLDDSLPRRQALALRLQSAGCQVDLSGPDWHTAGNLTPPKGPGKGRPLGKRLPRTEENNVPKLDGRLIDLGGNKVPLIEITNHGPGDVLELDIVDLPDGGNGELRKIGSTFPFPRLPAHKSINVLRYIGGITMGGNMMPAITIKAVGKTDSGENFEQEIFVSLGAR